LQLILRALDLCDRELRREWKTFPHLFLMLLDEEFSLLSAFGMHGFGDGSRVGMRGSIIPSHRPDTGRLA